MIYKYQGETMIGRIVALGGDEVDIDANGLQVNGSPQYEPKITKSTLPFVDGIKFPIKLKEGEIFVLADTRGESLDSRLFGPLSKENIQGKIFILLRRNNI